MSPTWSCTRKGNILRPWSGRAICTKERVGPSPGASDLRARRTCHIGTPQDARGLPAEPTGPPVPSKPSRAAVRPRALGIDSVAPPPLSGAPHRPPRPPKRKDPMSRYTRFASWYDTVSAEAI